MNNKERLMRTLRGEKVDRPAVCFYEINGLDEDVNNPDRFNIYNDPSWKPLLDLTREKTDRIVIRYVKFKNKEKSPIDDLKTVEEYIDENGSLWTITKIQGKDRVFTKRTRRDPDVLTVWNIEHFLKDEDDLEAWLELEEERFSGEVDVTNVLETEEQLGDTGIVSIDWQDPLSEVAELFSMADYTIVALTEQELFHKALERIFRLQCKQVEAIAKALPGRLWRFTGPEYACPPYLPPYLFKEYVVKYDKPLVEIVKKYGGYPRLHAHGKVGKVMEYFAETGCIGIDPIEPAPQGDVRLIDIREKYGRDMVLFGNLEITDIENMPTEEFEKKVIQAIEEGTSGEGRGFILMPSSCPFGRRIGQLTINNYRKIIEVLEKYYQHKDK